MWALLHPAPVCLFNQKPLYNRRGEVPDDIEPLRLGRGRVAREGTDLTVVAYLKTLHDAVDAADSLAEEGISAEVVDPRSLVPLDREVLRASLEKTGRLL